MNGGEIEVNYSLLPHSTRHDLLAAETRLMELHRQEVGKYLHCHWRQNGFPKPRAPAPGAFGLENYVLRGRAPVVRPAIWGT
jgi:hypothetical protein